MKQNAKDNVTQINLLQKLFKTAGNLQPIRKLWCVSLLDQFGVNKNCWNKQVPASAVFDELVVVDETVFGQGRDVGSLGRVDQLDEVDKRSRLFSHATLP